MQPKTTAYSPIVLFAVFAPLVLCLTTAHAQTLGDINRDGVVDISDAVLILNHVQHVTPLATNQLALPLADANIDGFINFADFQRVVDIILGRRAGEDFDFGLLSSDTDEDGLAFLDEYAAGTNPYLSDTDGDGLNDEVNLHSIGAIIVAQPAVEVSRLLAGSQGIVLARPPIELLRVTIGSASSGIVLAKPPVDVMRSAAGPGSMGIVLANPPVEVLRASVGSAGMSTLLAQPPIEISRQPFNSSSSGTLFAQPPLEFLRTGTQGNGVLVAQPPVEFIP